MADYESGWSSIVELQTGAEVSQKLNNAFTNIDVGLAAISSNEDALELLTPIYEYDSVENIPIATASQWYDIGVINLTSNPNGVYAYNITAIYTLLTAAQHNAKFRFSIDNGASWEEFTMKRDDEIDRFIFSHSFFEERYEDQALLLRLQATKEDATDTMTVQKAYITIEKKLNIVATP